MPDPIDNPTNPLNDNGHDDDVSEEADTGIPFKPDLDDDSDIDISNTPSDN